MPETGTYPEAVVEAPELVANDVKTERVQALLHPDRHVNDHGELGYDGSRYGRKVLEAVYDSLTSHDDPFNHHREYAEAYVDPAIGLRDVSVPSEEHRASEASFSLPAVSDTAVEQLESVLEEVDDEIRR